MRCDTSARTFSPESQYSERSASPEVLSPPLTRCNTPATPSSPELEHAERLTHLKVLPPPLTRCNTPATAFMPDIQHINPVAIPRNLSREGNHVNNSNTEATALTVEELSAPASGSGDSCQNVESPATAATDPSREPPSNQSSSADPHEHSCSVQIYLSEWRSPDAGNTMFQLPRESVWTMSLITRGIIAGPERYKEWTFAFLLGRPTTGSKRCRSSRMRRGI